MKGAFNNTCCATPPWGEACRRSLRAVSAHLDGIAAAQDHDEIVMRLAKIRLIERNLATKPGDAAPGQIDALTALMRICLAVQSRYGVANDELFTHMADMRRDWKPEDRLMRYAAPALEMI